MKVLLLFAFLIFFCYQSHALTCYNAQALNNNYKPTAEETIDCGDTSKMCMKVTAKGKIDGKEVKSATFSCDIGVCAQKGIESGKCAKIEDDANMCCCDTDKCNSSRSPMLLATTILPILVKFFY